MNEMQRRERYNCVKTREGLWEKMSMVLLILILVAGVIVHWLYTSCFTVVHFGFQSVFTEWFWCIIVGAIIVALLGKALGLL